jgi:predicted RNA binding protein YcfA (HicA-like mRNA interferase family)
LPRWRLLSSGEVTRILEANGFAVVRQRGSHIILQRRDGETTITIPVPNQREIAIGTLLSIVRQSRLDPVLFQMRD